jgi:hypothetical protein
MTTPDYAGTGESAMFFPKKKKGGYTSKIDE